MPHSKSSLQKSLKLIITLALLSIILSGIISSASPQNQVSYIYKKIGLNYNSLNRFVMPNKLTKFLKFNLSEAMEHNINLISSYKNSDILSNTACRSKRKDITWDFVYNCSEHGFNGTLSLTKKYGKYNLTPLYDVSKGSSDMLYPTLLPSALSMYKITHDRKYLSYAESTADAIEQHMLNDKNIIRMYSCTKGPCYAEPTDLNNYFLTSIAELAIYDPSYDHLAQRVADGIIRYGLSKNNIPYGSIYPNGTAAETVNGLSSNGGKEGSISITVIGLLHTYEATGNMTYLNKSHDILLSIWKNEKTRYNLIPRLFDSNSLKVIANDTQLYATGEFLRAYIYYYYLTHDPIIKDIISNYSEAASRAYWSKTDDGHGYFLYRVNAETGLPTDWTLETNWHKLDMSLIYAGEIVGKNYTGKVFQDMNTFWLDAGLSYKNYLFRHGTRPDGSPAYNKQSLIYSSMRTANYIMLRMLNSGAFNPSNCTWNDKIWDHINCTQSDHYQKYGYHSDVDVRTLKPDPNYYGLSVEPACGEFASLATLMFNTTPNVSMVWESFPLGDYTLEPFPTAYASDDIGFMNDVIMDYLHKEIILKKIKSKGKGRIHCSQTIEEVRENGKIYTNWHNKDINISDGSHAYVLVLKGGFFG